MNEHLRNAIGKTLFDQIVAEGWEEQPNGLKEQYMNMAEKVVATFVQPFLPVMQILAQDIILLHPAHKETITHIVKEATGKELEEIED